MDNTFLINLTNLGAACELAEREMKYDHAWMEKLSRRFLDKIYSKLTHVIRNGDMEQSYPGCINLSFAYVEGLSILYIKKRLQYLINNI